MKIKDLKINFRYLGGNIACLSVDSISGESVHNDINNEEAIIIFNSLVGEKADCQTVKSLLKENQELKKKYKNTVEKLSEQLELLTSKLDEYDLIVDERNQLKKQLEEYQKDIKDLDNQNKRAFENMQLNQLKVCNMIKQQKEFIKYLEDKIYSIEPKGTGINYNCEYDSEEDYVMATQEQSRLNTLKEILQKYKEIIGVSDESR